MVWPTNYDIKLKEYDMMNLPGQQLISDSAFNRLDHLINLNIKTSPGYIRRTGIAVTICHTHTQDFIEKLIEAGMNIAIINLEYATREEHVETIHRIREAAKSFSIKKKTTYPLAIAAKLKGRNLRTGHISPELGETVLIKTGDLVTLTSKETFRHKCTNHLIFVDLFNVGNYMTKGQYILIDNEAICLKVTASTPTNVVCRAERGGQLGSFKNIIIPSYLINLNNYSESDKEDIEMLIDLKVDMIIPSFVRQGKDVTKLRDIMGERGEKIFILTKIQTKDSFMDFDDILKVSDGIFISRRELASEIEPSKLMLAEKNMITRANHAAVSVLISAQILNSMKKKRTPLRTAMLDIFNMVQDGADVVVLSAATCVGPFALEAVICLATMCKESEICLWNMQISHTRIRSVPRFSVLPANQTATICLAAMISASKLLAVAVIVITSSGHTAHTISILHPRFPIIAVTRYPRVARLMHLWRGVVPVIYDDAPEINWETDVNLRANFAIKFGLRERFVRVGDPVIIVYGWRRGSDSTDSTRVIFVTKDM